MSSEERRRFGPPAEDALNAEPQDPQVWKAPAGVAASAAEADDEPGVGWLAALFGLKRRERLESRLRHLDRAIAAEPEAAVNYVLRGEVRLKLGRRDDAALDFGKALSLADAAFAESDWGLVAQALTDRALAGLRRAGYTARLADRKRA